MSEGFAIDSHDEVKRLLAIAKRHLRNILGSLGQRQLLSPAISS
jgi:hypothetical protein